MIQPTEIRYLKHQEIDFVKWDHCIEAATNGLIYAYSFYLDGMSRNWDALVLNDYEAVMPLTWNRKYGFHYLYQPFLCASLGIFGNRVNGELAMAFLYAVPVKFRYWDIYLNHGNFFGLEAFPLYQRINHVLNLNTPYEDLYKHYRTSYKQLLKRFERVGCVTRKNIPIEEVLSIAKEMLNEHAGKKDDDFDRFKMLFKTILKKNAVTYGIYSPNGELLASGVFLFSHQRAYYILAGNHPNGRTLGASHQVINSFIKDYANQNLLLDFEGSDINRIAFFFKGFGAVEEKYPGLRYNRLPLLVRWLKD